MKTKAKNKKGNRKHIHNKDHKTRQKQFKHDKNIEKQRQTQNKQRQKLNKKQKQKRIIKTTAQPYKHDKNHFIKKVKNHINNENKIKNLKTTKTLEKTRTTL